MIERIRNMEATEVIDLASYPGLHRQSKGVLVAVREVGLLKGDAFDITRLAVPARPKAELNRSHLVQLVFVGDREIPFYTFVNYEGWLLEYYRARMGMVFRFRTEAR